MSKFIVLGLDGLDPSMLSMLDSLNTGKIQKAVLDPYIPLTYPSWTTIMTGVNPGKHGIIDFFKYERTSRGWRSRLLTALDLDYPRIHEIIALSGHFRRIKYAVIDPIPSYPIIPAKGGFIASIAYFTPKSVSYPKRLLEKYYDKSEVEEAYHKLRKSIECGEALRASKRIIELHKNALEEFISNEYDFIWLTIGLPDAFLHKCG